MFKKCFVLLLLVLASVTASFAQEPTIVTIDGLYIERGPTESFRAGDKPVVDGDVLAFDIPGFGEYLEEIHVSINDVVLLIDDIPLPEIPAFIENIESGVVRFEFMVNDLTTEHRQKLYSRRGEATKRFVLGIQVGEGREISYSPKVEFYFQSIKNWKLWGLLLIGAFVVFFCVIIFLMPNAIRSAVPAQLQELFKSMVDRPDSLASSYRAFSFNKTQLAFWTLIVISSFIYIWSLTEDINAINSTALILLGISAGTSLAGNVMSMRKDQALGDSTSTNEVASKVRSLLESKISSRSFFRDILSDNQGISIQRVQSFVFNIVYGIIFLKSVILDYTMPNFGEVELLLLGISNGTYVLNKSSENE